jgi:hypothetical protein
MTQASACMPTQGEPDQLLDGPERDEELCLPLAASVCPSKKELDTIFSRLSAGSKAMHTPKDEFFGYYGDLTEIERTV